MLLNKETKTEQVLHRMIWFMVELFASVECYFFLKKLNLYQGIWICDFVSSEFSGGLFVLFIKWNKKNEKVFKHSFSVSNVMFQNSIM